MARDWKLQADLSNRLVFPNEIVATRLRPDILIYSQEKRLIVILELTVPWEERMDEAQERKKEKYNDLVYNCRENGWRPWCFPIEVGARGYAAKSVSYALSSLGVTGRRRKQIVREACGQAERASNWLWLKRKDRNWSS